VGAVVATVDLQGRYVEVNVDRTGLTLAALRRVTPWGERDVRMAVLVDTVDTLVGYDYEVPLDVNVRYRAVWDDGSSTLSAVVVMPASGQDWWVALGYPGISRPILIESFPALTSPLGHSLVQPLSARNPIPVIQARRGVQGTLTLLSLTLDEASALRTLIRQSPLFMLTGPADRGFEHGLYLLAQDYVEERAFRLAQRPERRWKITVQEVDRPPLDVPPPEQNTWQDWVVEGTTLGGWRDRTNLDLLTEPEVGP